MLTMFAFSVVLSIVISVIAVTVACILTQSDMILGPVARFCYSVIDQWPWTEYVFKPLLLCERCMAGQIAIWVFWLVVPHGTVPVALMFLFHAFTVCASILFAQLLSFTISKAK